MNLDFNAYLDLKKNVYFILKRKEMQFALANKTDETP